jgi:adenylate kinase
MRIVFLGPPGAGKGTQAYRLKDYLDIAHLSTGEMLRAAQQAGTELGCEAARYMNAGKLVPDEVVVGIVGHRLEENDCVHGCLFDGFPRTVPQAEALDRMLAGRLIPLDLVLALDVSEPQLTERLLARGRPDDDPETIRERFRQYRRLTQPLIEYYRSRKLLREIDAEGTPDQVFAKIRDAIDAVRSKDRQ